MSKFSITAALALAALTMSHVAVAQISDNAVRIGVLGDMSGPNADQQGPGDVVAARMAVMASTPSLLTQMSSSRQVDWL